MAAIKLGNSLNEMQVAWYSLAKQSINKNNLHFPKPSILWIFRCIFSHSRRWQSGIKMLNHNWQLMPKRRNNYCISICGYQGLAFFFFYRNILYWYWPQYLTFIMLRLFFILTFILIYMTVVNFHWNEITSLYYLVFSGKEELSIFQNPRLKTQSWRLYFVSMFLFKNRLYDSKNHPDTTGRWKFTRHENYRLLSNVSIDANIPNKILVKQIQQQI